MKTLVYNKSTKSFAEGGADYIVIGIARAVAGGASGIKIADLPTDRFDSIYAGVNGNVRSKIATYFHIDSDNFDVYVTKKCTRDDVSQTKDEVEKSLEDKASEYYRDRMR